MDEVDAYFPYDAYRPYQRDMLEFAARCARNGGIAMIDAPTGCGKTGLATSFLIDAINRL
jgi:DNA excision repair protein ERCC-2